jgi:putative NADPH-quinone reductase
MIAPLLFLQKYIVKTSKTLVIVTHPDIDKSSVNKRWLEELEKNQDIVTIHQLNKNYPDNVIDVAAEQRLLLSHDNIIFQFPFYWFSTPPLLKKWLDDVLVRGFAYGSGETERKLTGKRMGLAVSTGIKAVDYDRNGRYAFTLEELVRPLQLTIKYISAKPLPIFAFYGAEYEYSTEDLELSAAQYQQYIKQISVESYDVASVAAV